MEKILGSSFENVIYIVAFIVPGFVISQIIATVVPREKELEYVSFIRFIMYSCINYAVWSWLIVLIATSHFLKEHLLCQIFGVLFFVLISPILIGIILAFMVEKRIFHKFLECIGFSITNDPVPTSWDYVFSKLDTSPIVMIKFEDGGTIAGRFSFASSDNNERDICLESIYTIDPNTGQWSKSKQSGEVLVRGDKIKWIAFIPEV